MLWFGAQSRCNGELWGARLSRPTRARGSPITGASERVRQSLCGRCEQAASFTEATCFPKMSPGTEHSPVPTRGHGPRSTEEGGRSVEQWFSGCRMQAAGCRRGIGGCPHGAGSDNALWPPGLSGGCHPQALQPQGLWAASLENPAGQVRGLPW